MLKFLLFIMQVCALVLLAFGTYYTIAGQLGEPVPADQDFQCFVIGSLLFLISRDLWREEE